MKTLFLILFLTILSCEKEPPKTYTLKVFFNDGSVDTLKVDYGYQIDEYGNLQRLGWAECHTIAKSVKYVKEIR